MGCVSFQVAKSFLQTIAGLMGHILMTMSTGDCEDRWENCRECLKMAASALAKSEDRAKCEKLSGVLFVAWQTLVAGEVPKELCDPTDESHITLKVHVPDAGDEFPRLQQAADLHIEEMTLAAEDLGRLLVHVREAGFEPAGTLILEAQQCVLNVASALDPDNSDK